MNVTKKTASTAQVEQWLDTQESLQAIQQLLAPASPLVSGHLFGDTGGAETLGVYVAGRGNLVFAAVGDWIVREGNVVAIISDAIFKMVYVQESAVPKEIAQYFKVAGERVNAPENAHQIRATHPRALADLDDNIDQTFDRR